MVDKIDLNNLRDLSNYEIKEINTILGARYWIIRGSIAAIFAITLVMAGCPPYKVWEQRLHGQAELRRAEQNRQIEIEEARAKFEASELLNQAEVKRAEGLAAATELVVDSFGGPEAYLRYLWIQSLENNKADIIYVPTEAGLPILEAGKKVVNEKN